MPSIPYRRVWSASAGERASAQIRRQGGGEGARVGRASSSSSASATRTLSASFWLVSLIAINACGLASTATRGGGPPRSGATGHVLLLFSQLQQEIAARVGLSRPQATNIIRGRFGASRSIVRRVLEVARAA